MRDITESGHFYSLNQVNWRLYLSCPECSRTYYHDFECPESLLDWDQEVKDMKEEEDVVE